MVASTFKDGTASWASNQDFASSYSYDANGNIRNLIRSGYESVSPLVNRDMDNLSYTYQSGTNRLIAVTDAINAANYTTDLDGVINYTYDAVGRLQSDDGEEIDTIRWTPDSKVQEVIRTTGSSKPDLQFTYDATGSRTIKKVINDKNNPALDEYTYYVRDASGQIMAIYKGKQNNVWLQEQPIYGSDRIGQRNDSILVATIVGQVPANIDDYRATENTVWDIPVQGPLTQVEITSLTNLLGFPARLLIPVAGNQEVNFPLSSNIAVGSISHTFTGQQGINSYVREDLFGAPIFRTFTAKKYNGTDNLCLVFGKNGNLMQGQAGIYSNYLGKSLAMRVPGTTDEYYLFTHSNNAVVGGSTGLLLAHRIDMTANAGNGVVTNKNLAFDVSGGYGSGMALIEDVDGGNSRLFARQHIGNTCNIVGFPVTETGIGNGQVMTSFPAIATASSAEMQISPDGQFLAVANLNDNFGLWAGTPEIFIYRLNADFSTLTPHDTIFIGGGSYTFSFDFSEGSNFIYYTNTTLSNNFGTSQGLNRYSINLGGSGVIEPNLLGEVRRGKNGNIYVATPQENKITEIINPEEASPSSANPNLTATYEATGGLPLQEHRLTRQNAGNIFCRVIGNKQYELSDHLGNVRAVISDVKEADASVGVSPNNFRAQLLAANNYYPYGMEMPGRTFNSPDYRYGFQGMEKDDEMKGGGNSYDFGARLCDPRLGRWLSQDALAMNSPSWSPYRFGLDNPIYWMDPDGNEERPSGTWSLDLANLIDDGVEIAADFYLENDDEDWIENGLTATALDLARGFTGVLRVGVNSAKGVERITNAQDNYDYAIGISLILTDAGTTAGAALSVAGTAERAAHSIALRGTRQSVGIVGKTDDLTSMAKLDKYDNLMGALPSAQWKAALKKAGGDYAKAAKDFWKKVNKPWLDDMISKGKAIRAKSTPNKANMAGKQKGTLSGYGREVKYLESKGYFYDPVSKLFVPGAAIGGAAAMTGTAATTGQLPSNSDKTDPEKE